MRSASLRRKCSPQSVWLKMVSKPIASRSVKASKDWSRRTVPRPTKKAQPQLAQGQGPSGGGIRHRGLHRTSRIAPAHRSAAARRVCGQGSPFCRKSRHRIYRAVAGAAGENVQAAHPCNAAFRRSSAREAGHLARAEVGRADRVRRMDCGSQSSASRYSSDFATTRILATACFRVDAPSSIVREFNLSSWEPWRRPCAPPKDRSQSLACGW